MKNKIFVVDGMTCHSCERLIEDSLRGKVSSVRASFKKGTVSVGYSDKKISESGIESLIVKAGYKVCKHAEMRGNKSWSDKAGFIVMIISFLVLAFIIYRWVLTLGITFPSVGENASLLLLFLVGVLTGFHCVSMCGGFIVSYMTRNAAAGRAGFTQHVVYGGSKTLSYIILGSLFGLIGGAVSFSVGLRSGVAIVAGLFMVAYGLSMLGIAFFRRFQVNPKFLARWTAKTSGRVHGHFKAPLITGLLSGLFIACGPLQAMYIYAAGTGSAVKGALALAAFGLGTLPILLGFASVATVISHDTMKKFMKISAVVVIILGVIMINRGLTFAGSSFSYNAITASSSSVASSSMVDGVQVISMDVLASGWSPDSFTLKKGVPVRWLINVKELTSCNNEIIVKAYGLDIKLHEGLNTVEFTPMISETVRWSCWMGMIPGTFIVSDDGTATDAQISEASVISASGGTCGASGGGCGCGGAR